MSKKKASKGFTLLEAVIALAIWMVLSLSVVIIWQFSAERSNALIARQSAFENARGSMDALLMNIQMAHTIELNVDRDYNLQRIRLTQQGPLPNYYFHFNANARPHQYIYRRLVFGRTGNAANYIADGIALVRIEPEFGYERYIHITIQTACEEYPVVLEGRVDIRYKRLTVNQPGRVALAPS